jgi:hypothetical protein
MKAGERGMKAHIMGKAKVKRQKVKDMAGDALRARRQGNE